MGISKVHETISVEATTRFYNSVPINIATINGVEYVGQQNVFHATGVDISSAVVKHCGNAIKYVNCRKSFPLNDLSRMSFVGKDMAEFLQWIFAKDKSVSAKPNLKKVVPIQSNKIVTMYKTPPQVYEYIEDLLDENKFLIKQLESNVSNTRTVLKEAKLHKQGLRALKQVLEMEDEEADNSSACTRTLNTNWLNNIEWDYLSPANFSKLWGVYDLVVTMSDADKELHQKKRADDSKIWMAFSLKITNFANRFGVTALKNTVSKKVEHRYNKSKNTNIFPVWVLELYFEENYGHCRNEIIPDQRVAIGWVEKTIAKSHGCGGRLKKVV